MATKTNGQAHCQLGHQLNLMKVTNELRVSVFIIILILTSYQTTTTTVECAENEPTQAAATINKSSRDDRFSLSSWWNFGNSQADINNKKTSTSSDRQCGYQLNQSRSAKHKKHHKKHYQRSYTPSGRIVGGRQATISQFP